MVCFGILLPCIAFTLSNAAGPVLATIARMTDIYGPGDTRSPLFHMSLTSGVQGYFPLLGDHTGAVQANELRY